MDDKSLHNLKRIAQAMDRLRRDADAVSQGVISLREDLAVLKAQCDRLYEEANGD